MLGVKLRNIRYNEWKIGRTLYNLECASKGNRVRKLDIVRTCA